MGKRWIKDHVRDTYYKSAKKEGYRSRAAYKLIQIQKKFKILRPGISVLDLCCAPGSWLQVIRRFVGPSGFIVGVDIEKMPKLKDITFIQADIFSDDIIEKVVNISGKKNFDAVLSDCSPKLSGIKDLDNFRQISLAERSLEIAQALLNTHGVFVSKLFQGAEFKKYTQRVKEIFQKVFFYKPPASRQQSPEIYIVAKRLKMAHTSS